MLLLFDKDGPFEDKEGEIQSRSPKVQFLSLFKCYFSYQKIPKN